jgi:hypothetical protein
MTSTAEYQRQTLEELRYLNAAVERIADATEALVLQARIALGAAPGEAELKADAADEQLRQELNPAEVMSRLDHARWNLEKNRGTK